MCSYSGSQYNIHTYNHELNINKKHKYCDFIITHLTVYVNNCHVALFMQSQRNVIQTDLMRLVFTLQRSFRPSQTFAFRLWSAIVESHRG